VTVTPLPVVTPVPAPPTEPDTSPDAPQSGAPSQATFAQTLTDALAATAGALERADGAERAFAAGRGGLQEMMLQRAQADVALSIASAAATRAAQTLTTILGMQV
jgi:flagellar hook-basal body complex protein FliE